MGECRTRVYRDGALAAVDFPVADVSEYLEEDGTVVWVDLCGPTPEQLKELSEELGFHELAVEDAVSAHQRPKLDHYATHLFLACHSVAVLPDLSGLEEREVDAFVGERFLVTVRKDQAFSLVPVLERWDRSPKLASQGVGFLLYGLLDVIVDGYFSTVQTFDDFYDEVSEGIFAEQPLDAAQQRGWFQMRRALVQFHRLVVPMREVISSLMRREKGTVSEQLYPYYQDVYDHILRVSESTESLRDLVSTIVETNISLRDYRQNVITRKITSWAAIIAVPTLITGWYGMNVPYPGSGEHSGVLVAASLTAGVSGLLYVVFKLRRWL